MFAISWTRLNSSLVQSLHSGSETKTKSKFESNFNMLLKFPKLFPYSPALIIIFFCHIIYAHHRLDYLRFLFEDYQCNRWYFEVVDLYRRITFTGILPLLSRYHSSFLIERHSHWNKSILYRYPRGYRLHFSWSYSLVHTSTLPSPIFITSRDSAFVAYAGCILALISTISFRELAPFRVDFTNLIAVVCQYLILLMFLAGMMLETNTTEPFHFSDFQLGCCLLGLNLMIALLVFWGGYLR